MAETILKTFGCYVGIFDLISEMNKQERYYSGFEQAKAKAKENNHSWATLFYFNNQFISRARKGEILAWTLLFGGCFKVRIQIFSDEQDLILSEEQIRHFLGKEAYDLICPSGKIAVESLENAGNPHLQAVLELEPGIYRVGLSLDFDEVGKHEFLESEKEYPENDGPDWFIVMKKVGEI
jgi:hypothetical protein